MKRTDIRIVHRGNVAEIQPARLQLDISDVAIRRIVNALASQGLCIRNDPRPHTLVVCEIPGTEAPKGV